MTGNEILALGNAAIAATEPFEVYPSIGTASRLVETAGQFAYEVLAAGAGTFLVDEAQRYCDFAADRIGLAPLSREIWKLTFPDGRTVKLMPPLSFTVWQYLEEYRVKPALREIGGAPADSSLGAFLVVLSGFACHADAEADRKILSVTKGLVELATERSKADTRRVTWLAGSIVEGVHYLFNGVKLKCSLALLSTTLIAALKPIETNVQPPEEQQSSEPGSSPAPTNERWYYDRDEDVPPTFYKERSLRGRKSHLAMAFPDQEGPDQKRLQTEAEIGDVAVVRLRGQVWRVYFRTKELFELAESRFEAFKHSPANTSNRR